MYDKRIFTLIWQKLDLGKSPNVDHTNRYWYIPSFILVTLLVISKFKTKFVSVLSSSSFDISATYLLTVFNYSSSNSFDNEIIIGNASFLDNLPKNLRIERN